MMISEEELREGSELELNYERVVDVFIPTSVPKITTDEPLGQQKRRNEYELGKAYRAAHEGKRFDPEEVL